ncbi:MAG: aerotolerance regulator BatB [Candidatus Tectimicrobiota bacterium]|nr:MAG: aerotolerance regulator BatB [Candidatus Tectomicrobia bacterium]
MRFAHPEALWLLLLAPLLSGLLVVAGKRRRRFLTQLGKAPGLLPPPSWLHTPAAQVGLALAFLLGLVGALADPRVAAGPPHLRRGALDVVLILDVSKSMAAEDYGRRSRLARAREVARQLLPSLRGNRVGLVLFAGTSFVQAELTEDLTALDFMLRQWVTVDAVGVGGSDLTAALAAGLRLFAPAASREKVVVLFSDGGSGEGNWHEVTSQATRQGVRIVTLGFGSLQPSPVPRYDAQGRFQGYLQVDGQVVTTRLNEAPLRQLAAATGGLYRRIGHESDARGLLTQAEVAGAALERAERRLFQPFVLLSLLAFGVRTLSTRL